MWNFLILPALFVGFTSGACDDPDYVVAVALFKKQSTNNQFLRNLKNEYRQIHILVARDPYSTEFDGALVEVNCRMRDFANVLVADSTLFQRHMRHCLRRFTETRNQQCVSAIEALTRIIPSAYDSD